MLENSSRRGLFSTLCASWRDLVMVSHREKQNMEFEKIKVACSDMLFLPYHVLPTHIHQSLNTNEYKKASWITRFSLFVKRKAMIEPGGPLEWPSCIDLPQWEGTLLLLHLKALIFMNPRHTCLSANYILAWEPHPMHSKVSPIKINE